MNSVKLRVKKQHDKRTLDTNTDISRGHEVKEETKRKIKPTVKEDCAKQRGAYLKNVGRSASTNTHRVIAQSKTILFTKASPQNVH